MFRIIRLHKEHDDIISVLSDSTGIVKSDVSWMLIEIGIMSMKNAQKENEDLREFIVRLKESIKSDDNLNAVSKGLEKIFA